MTLYAVTRTVQDPISADDHLASLARRAGAGDSAAFEEIVGLYQVDVARLCFAIGGDLERALAKLGVADRELLGLRFGLGMDSGEIALRVGIGRSGVRMRLHRLMRRLRSELGDE